MSIASSKEELAEARAKVADSPTEQLERDLAYWATAKVDHVKAHNELTAQRSHVGEMYQEADAWTDLIAEELHRRRTGPERPL